MSLETAGLAHLHHHRLHRGVGVLRSEGDRSREWRVGPDHDRGREEEAANDRAGATWRVGFDHGHDDWFRGSSCPDRKATESDLRVVDAGRQGCRSQVKTLAVPRTRYVRRRNG